jgi:hypothetical protein
VILDGKRDISRDGDEEDRKTDECAEPAKHIWS